MPEWYYGGIQFAIGGDIEIEPNITLSRQRFGYDIGNWYIAYPGGMTMTNPVNGRSRIAAIMTKSESDRLKIMGVIVIIH